MPFVGLTFQTYVVRPKLGRADERSPDFVLPEHLAGYERSSESLLVAAVRDSDEVTVGMGGGWRLIHTGRPDVLLVKAAEVNEPYAGTGIDRELVDVLTKFAEQQSILQVFIPAEVQQQLES